MLSKAGLIGYEYFVSDTQGANWGYRTAWLFFGTGIFTTIAAYFYVPETASRNAVSFAILEYSLPPWHDD